MTKQGRPRGNSNASPSAPYLASKNSGGLSHRPPKPMPNVSP